MKIKIYATIDEKGIDGFGFKKEDREFRMLRASANSWRGMRFVEGNITKEEKEKIIEAFSKNHYRKCAELIYLFVK